MPRFVGNKSLMVLLALIGVGILIGFGALIGLNTQEPVVTPTPSPIITTSPPTPSLSPTRTITPPVTTPIPPATNTPAPTVSRVNIYMVAIDDNGKTGTRIGCGDSLIPVTVNIQPTTTPLRAAFEQLLFVKTQFFGQSGLYNSLYQSNLRVDRAVIQNGIATINLSGQVRLGGTCDNPRFEQQLKQTALQFPSVRQANISINGTSLEQVVSEK